MNTLAVFSCLVAVAHCGVIAPIAGPYGAYGAPAAAIVRAPAHDSASIESHRLGGNFAYATAEAHAYASVTPQFATRRDPVAETTHVHQPAPIATVVPAPIVTTKHIAQPVLAQKPIIGSQPVIGPVAKHVTVEQPVFKTRTVTQQAHVAYTQAAPAGVIATHAAPAAIGAYAAGPAIAAPAAIGAYAAAPAAIGAYAAGPAIGAYGAGYGLGLPIAGKTILPAAEY